VVRSLRWLGGFDRFPIVWQLAHSSHQTVRWHHLAVRSWCRFELPCGWIVAAVIGRIACTHGLIETGIDQLLREWQRGKLPEHFGEMHQRRLSSRLLPWSCQHSMLRCQQRQSASASSSCSATARQSSAASSSASDLISSRSPLLCERRAWRLSTHFSELLRRHLPFRLLPRRC